jgi:hypothetical protein
VGIFHPSVLLKPLVWLLDYYLSRLSSHEYVFDPFPLGELGHASDQAYLINGLINHTVLTPCYVNLGPMTITNLLKSMLQTIKSHCTLHRRLLFSTSLLATSSSVFSPHDSNQIDKLE